MARVIPRTALCLTLALALAACASRAAPTAAPTPTVPPTASVRAATAAPSHTPLPSATLVPTLTPTPVPAFRRLTSGGCCVQPFWSSDGSQVWYVDRPSETAPSGIWGVAVEGGEPRFVTDRLGLYSPDRTLVAYPEGGQTYIERIGGERWVVPSGGRAISFAPDGARIAWQVVTGEGGFDRRRVEVWVANVDGSEARAAAELTGGSLAGWFPSGAQLLLAGREEDATQSFLAVLDLRTGDQDVIRRGARMRGARLSPEGGWLAYLTTFSGDPTQDGLWVMRADGTGAHRLPTFGAYLWRSEGRLLVVPLDLSQVSHPLLEVDVLTGDVRILTDPALTPLQIAGGDWAVSPAGDRLVFVSAGDHNLWVLDLP